jgi:GAF domain-containing protein
MNKQTNTASVNKSNVLIEAIDFFTQKFSIHQLSDYAFEFVNEVLALRSSAMFLKEGPSFVLKKQFNYHIHAYCIKDTPNLQRIATFHGSILTSNFEGYFEAEDIQALKPRLIIPMIIKDLLYGFMVSDCKDECYFSNYKLHLSKALMQLTNNALESSHNLEELQLTNKQLDQKVFNLFSINQSSRMLLSELNLNSLYSLSIDIFSELTSSRITSFGLYDEIRDRIVLRGYRDVYSPKKIHLEFQLEESCYVGYKVVFHYQKDKEQLLGIFKNYDDFQLLDAEYIVLIVKERVLGFVTISKPFNDRAYDQSLFELIEGLAASAYISFNNAMYFSEIDRQRKSIQQKLHALTNLNILIKNINSCSTLEELCDISVKTLQYSFGIKKALIAMRENDRYIIKNSLGYASSSSELMINHKWQDICKDSVSCYIAEEASDYLSAAFLEEAGGCSCLVISPIHTGNTDFEEDSLPLGYIVVLATAQNLREEEVLLIETMANSIAPVIKHLQTVTHIKQEYILNRKEAFLRSLQHKVSNRKEYSMDFYLYYRKMPQLPFEQADLTPYQQYEHYFFDHMLLILSYDSLSGPELTELRETGSQEAVVAAIQEAYKEHEGRAISISY